jgi:hypothetical protein
MKNMTEVVIGEFAAELSRAARLGDADREAGIVHRTMPGALQELQLSGAPLQEHALYRAYDIGYMHQGIMDANRVARNG